MMQYNATFPSMATADCQLRDENERFGSDGRSCKYESVESRMSAMMSSSESPFRDINAADRKQVEMERRNRLAALVKEGVLRPPDVFMKSGRNRFIANLVPGTLSYYQRIRENSFLFREYQACSNDAEKQRIIQEIVESVWLNEGRFLVIDKELNSVVVVDDHKLPIMIADDLMYRENTFPAGKGFKSLRKIRATTSFGKKKAENQSPNNSNCIDKSRNNNGGHHHRGRTPHHRGNTRRNNMGDDTVM
ncbi:hypothetical protein IV203_027728 [Nitzschia inconspicua]|uniref:Uncharacterized protein n=1 Tax=Nitzschia inconspicua TaxID=303405 RepID=A0A9K3LXK7_9STRA|nr:hypothetical protein IV203_027728 [Nitzschia inconspicua]